MRVAPVAVAGTCLAAAVAVAGCQSTQATSRQRAAEGKKLAQTRNISIGQESNQVKVEDTAILTDSNGTAVVVTLRNESNRTLIDVPIQINVLDRKGRSIFRNDIQGTQASLTEVAALEPHQTFDWVHDQVLVAPNTARKVEVTVGQSSTPAPPRLPKIEVGKPKLERDPVSGLLARGDVENLSDIPQTELTFYGVARRGGRIVAAGRGALKNLTPNHPFHFNVFFIGNPQGADLEVEAPPTVVQ